MNQTKFKELLSQMPPLRHSIEGETFNINHSEVVKWIMAQPGFKDWVWNRIHDSACLRYDSETGKWSGTGKPTGSVGRPKVRKFDDIRSSFPISAETALGVRAIHRAAFEATGIGMSSFYSMLNKAVKLGAVIKDSSNPLFPKYWMPLVVKSEDLD